MNKYAVDIGVSDNASDIYIAPNYHYIKYTNLAIVFVPVNYTCTKCSIYGRNIH